MVHLLDPVQDPRWDEFVRSHPRASAFHTVGWLKSLARTYGYQPLALTTSAPGQELENGLVLCRIKSWLTGHRLVSLPFSDHCQPLVDQPDSEREMLAWLERHKEKEALKYVELRPLGNQARNADSLGGFEASQAYLFHQLDLRPGEEELFGGFHKTAVRQMIRRAEREGLQIQQGRSPAILKGFYHLMQLTRRRFRLPPQPLSWFRHLIRNLGDALTIWTASCNGRPAAAILTLSFQDRAIYKYGCSDAQFRNLGGTQILLWKAIQKARNEGVRVLDMGRTDEGNRGLAAFKERWGAQRSKLVYYRCATSATAAQPAGWMQPLAKKVFSQAPAAVVNLSGRLLYKHFG